MWPLRWILRWETREDRLPCVYQRMFQMKYVIWLVPRIHAIKFWGILLGRGICGGNCGQLWLLPCCQVFALGLQHYFDPNSWSSGDNFQVAGYLEGIGSWLNAGCLDICWNWLPGGGNGRLVPNQKRKSQERYIKSQIGWSWECTCHRKLVKVDCMEV